MPVYEAAEFPLRVGVALGAGSAAALAEIGALEVLIEDGIPIDCVAGTSAGAIVGAALAAGELDAFRTSMETLSRRRVLSLFDLAWPREGLLRGRRALEFVRPYLGDSIEKLERPYAAVATDLRSGDEVLLRGGPVFDAVRASIAIPGIFTPWWVGGRPLVDGGLVNPVPVSAARSLGADVVIALNVLPLREPRVSSRVLHDHLEQIHAGEAEQRGADPDRDDKLGLVEVVGRASRILACQVASARLREDRPDCLIQISVPEIGMFDVHRTAELARIGREQARKALPAVRRALERALPLSSRLQAWSQRVRPRLAALARRGATHAP